MTTRELARELEKQGHRVKTYVRKDGGILITEIDGVKYSGAKGNKVARSILGQKLSQARESQTKQALRERKKRKRRTTDVAEDIQRQQRRVNRKLRERDERLDERNRSPLGRITMSKLRYILETEGEDAVRRYLDEAEKYATGIAYEGSVEALYKDIQAIALQVYRKAQGVVIYDDKSKALKDTLLQTAKYLNKIVEFLKRPTNMKQFKEEWIDIVRYDILAKAYDEHATPSQNLINVRGAYQKILLLFNQKK